MSEQVVPLNVAAEPERRDAARWARRERARVQREASVNIGEVERLASAVAGGLLAAYGVRRKGWSGLGLAIVGVELVRRGMTGHCMAYEAMGVSTKDGKLQIDKRRNPELDPSKAVKARGVATIRRPRSELYRMWRDFSQLPRFMQHLERVDVMSPTRSHWVTKGPAGTSIEWDADIIAERDGEYIEWASVAAADVPNRGTVQFVDAADGDGTEVIVTLEAEPPAGKVGDFVARLFGRSPQQEVEDAVKRFREAAERHAPLSSGQRGASSSSSSSSTSTSSSTGASTSMLGTSSMSSSNPRSSLGRDSAEPT